MLVAIFCENTSVAPVSRREGVTRGAHTNSRQNRHVCDTLAIMVRRVWEKIEPWLSRAGHFDLFIIKTGLGALIMTFLSGVGVAVAAWWSKAQLYQIILATMFGMAAMLLIANQSLKLITSWKLPSSVTRQRARQLDRKHPGGARLGGSTAIIITVLSAALIIVLGFYISSTYSAWKRDIDSTYLMVLPAQVFPWSKDRDSS
jgi:hypothetical protein